MASTKNNTKTAPKTAPKAPKPPKAPKTEAAPVATFTDAQVQDIVAQAVAAALAQFAANTEAANTEAPKDEAPKAEAPKTAPAPDAEKLARVTKSNAAILATVPANNRAKVSATLKRVQDAGYPFARLSVNAKHQLDALRIYCGEAGHGKDEAFANCMTKPAKAYAAKRDEAARAGQPKPKAPKGVFVWSPVHGGQLYARGIFGEVSD